MSKRLMKNIHTIKILKSFKWVYLPTILTPSLTKEWAIFGFEEKYSHHDAYEISVQFRMSIKVTKNNKESLSIINGINYSLGFSLEKSIIEIILKNKRIFTLWLFFSTLVWSKVSRDEKATQTVISSINNLFFITIIMYIALNSDTLFN